MKRFDVIEQLIEKPVCTIFDVGAGVGTYTARFLDLFPEVHIYAFEPAPETLHKLRQNVGREERVEIVPMAVSGRDGEAMLRINDLPVTNSLLEFADTWPQRKTLDCVAVETVTLSSFCAVNGVEHIDLLKLDCQGIELWVLQGAVSLFRRGYVGLVFTELLYYPRYEGQCYHFGIASFLCNYGYRLHSLFPSYSQEHGLLYADGIFVK